MTVGQKITAICALLLTLTLILGATAVLNIRHIYGNVQAITTSSLPGVYQIEKLAQDAEETHASMLLHIATTDPKLKTKMENKIALSFKDFDEALAAYEKTISTPEGRKLFEQIAPAYQRFKESWPPLQALSRSLDKSAVDRWHAEGGPALLALQATLAAEVEFSKQEGDRNAAAASRTVTSAQLWAYILLTFSVLLGSCLAFFTVRGITSVLKRSVGDLSDGATQVASAASQVSASSQSLAQGTSEQAASLEETSASSEELSAMTRRNAENASELAGVMSLVEQRVVQANRSLGQMSASMQDINTSSQGISKIMNVIDGIAFQTNILALNAAVEAARAGEAGMGFAVVADEVRNLAQRCAEAAKDTALLIETSISKSNEGSSNLSQVSAAIGHITDSSSRVKILIDELNVSSQEQAKGIDQISNAITQMQHVTQQSAATAEEGAAAGEELNAQADTMREVVESIRGLVESSKSRG